MTEYRVERWWGQWCVADYPPSRVNKDGLPYPLTVHRWRWQAEISAWFKRRADAKREGVKCTCPQYIGQNRNCPVCYPENELRPPQRPQGEEELWLGNGPCAYCSTLYGDPHEPGCDRPRLTPTPKAIGEEDARMGPKELSAGERLAERLPSGEDFLRGTVDCSGANTEPDPVAGPLTHAANCAVHANPYLPPACDCQVSSSPQGNDELVKRLRRRCGCGVGGETCLYCEAAAALERMERRDKYCDEAFRYYEETLDEQQATIAELRSQLEGAVGALEWAIERIAEPYLKTVGYSEARAALANAQGKCACEIFPAKYCPVHANIREGKE